MSLKKTPKKAKGPKEWDSTTQNLSRLTYSPLELKLKQNVQTRYTNAHRPVKPAPDLHPMLPNTKTVQWEDWNLKEPVDFDSELKRLPLSQKVTPVRVRVRKSPIVEKVDKKDKKSLDKENDKENSMDLNRIASELEPISSALGHLDHVLSQRQKIGLEERVPDIKVSNDFPSLLSRAESTLANMTQFITQVSNLTRDLIIRRTTRSRKHNLNSKNHKAPIYHSGDNSEV